HYEKVGVIIVAFRNAALKITEINRGHLHLNPQLSQVSLDYYRRVFERLARRGHNQRQLHTITFRIIQFRTILLASRCKTGFGQKRPRSFQVELNARKVSGDPAAIAWRDETVKRRGQSLQSDRSNCLAVERDRHGLTESRIVEPCALDRIGRRSALNLSLIEVEAEIVGLQPRTEIGNLRYPGLRMQLRIVRRAETVVDVHGALPQTRESVVRVLHDLDHQLIQVWQRRARRVFFPVVRVAFERDTFAWRDRFDGECAGGDDTRRISGQAVGLTQSAAVEISLEDVTRQHGQIREIIFG